MLQLIWIILRLPQCELIIMQNPPCIPNLLILVMLKYIKRYKLIIDWHNYGYSIMRVNGVNPKIVKLAEWYEYLLGKFANSNLCVSQAF